MKHAIKIMAAVAAFVFAFAAFADTEKVGDYTWTYTVTDFDGNTGAVIANGNDCAVSPKPTGALTIPSTLGGCPVRKLGDDSLKSCYSLTSVTIPSTVMTIGSDAFFYCDSLKSVTVPESVKSFGSSAFTYCERLAEFSVASGNPEYKSVNGHLLTKDGRRLVFGVVDANGESTIPSGVTIIGRDAFNGRRGLTSVTIPGSVTVISYCAFWACGNMTSVTIPDSVTDMGVKAFGACGKLTSASLPGRFRDDPFYRNSVFERCPDNLVITFRAPQFTVDGGVLTKVVANGNDNLTIPSTVTSIGNGAFKYLANVTNVTIPASVTLIDKRAFDGCSALKSFSVASGNLNYKSVSGLLLTKDGKTLVHGVNGAVTIPSGVATIGDSAFDRLAGLTSVTFPASVTNIDDYAFYYCTGLESVTLPDSIISVGDHVFAHCSGLKAASLPGRLNGKIKSYVFSNCASDFEATYRTPQFTINNGALTKVVANGNDSVTVPSTVTSIGNGAFKNLENVTSVTIPASVTSIHKRAFDGCSALKSFSVASGNPNYKSVSGLLLTKDGKTLVHGVNGVVTIPSGVTTIGDSAFDRLAGLTSVTIPASVTNIDDYAFYYCIGLKSVTIPDGVVLIENRVFFNCTGLTSISLPQQFDGNLDEANVFGNCSSSLKIHYRTPDFTIYNGKLASVSLNDATRVIIPGSVTEIAFAAFSGCGAMKYVTIPDSVTAIGFQAFYTCSSLMSVTIPDSVTSIDKYAFAYCSSLASVTLPARFKDNLDESVFDGCPEGLKITYRSVSSSIWTLKYHSNNGKNDLDTQNFNIGEAKRLYYMNSRLGWEYKDEDGFNYVFLGWAKSPTGAVAYENGALVKDLAAVGKVMHIYAVWQKRAYEVCFHSNDEDGLVEYQEFRPNIAKNLYWLDSGLGWTRPGYDFLGWAKAPTSTAVVYANGETVNNLVEQGQTLHLYAVWTADQSTYTVRFNKNDGSGATANQTFKVGETKNLLWKDSELKWTRSGYTFKGWSESASGAVKYANGEKVKNIAAGGATKNLYAVWQSNQPVYTVRFHKNDGSGATVDQVFKVGESKSLLWKDSQLKWSRDGYTFVGWVPWDPSKQACLCKYVNGETVKDLGATGAVVHLYAGWKSSGDYLVCFNKNDGTGAKMNQIIQRDKDVALAWKDSQLGWTRSGYTFKGWAESVSGAVKYANGATVKNLAAAGATKQLYAVWAGAANSFAAYVAFRTAVSSSLATVSSASTASEAVVPEWAVGTFYGGDDDSFAMITVSADGEVSGIILSWNGTWTIEGVADGLCIDAEVVDGAGNVEPTILLISQTDDGHSLIESEDGSIRVMN